MTDKITPEAVEAALEGATPGPWSASMGRLVRVNAMRERGIPVVVAGVHKIGSKGGVPYGDVEANARLIAMAPDLAAAYLAQAEEIERLRNERDKWVTYAHLYCAWVNDVGERLEERREELDPDFPPDEALLVLMDQAEAGIVAAYRATEDEV